ncbi:hypothetical protein SAMN05444851_2180 [Aliiroseovarius sediminilitoris]|uniref:Uncharacterized protein n=1 Tax=Aliiroseovarius sediminilitoris TaxID=1173584 RepID=A0A1I0Q3J0_9RHOB|nr:hypothetical protein [Aliiroseovarius sediminilitoris]SEW21353.1 hypothetical protein SAMN05444851_2180 [Aliiroseovarius sediminilitoris]
MTKYMAIVACVATIGVAAPGFAKTYDCKVDEAGSGDNKGIPPHIIVTDDNGKISVIDGLIQNTIGKPIAAQVETENAKRITYTWTLEQIKGDVSQRSASQIARLVFRLTYQKATGTAIASMKPVGYRNTFRAKGKCTVK